MKTITYYILSNGFPYSYLLYFKQQFQKLVLTYRNKPLLIRTSNASRCNVIKNVVKSYGKSF